MSTATVSGGWKIVVGSAVVLSAMVVLILAIAGTGDPGLHLAIRTTAQTSFVLFIAAFTASSLYRYWRRPWSRWLLVHRRYVGLSFAVSHTLHLALIAALASTSTEFRATVVPAMLLGGALAYVFIALMAATSTDTAVRALGSRRWKRLHTVGGYYIWFVFFQSFAGRGLQNPAYIPVTVLCVGAVALRVSAVLASRRSAALIEQSAPSV